VELVKEIQFMSAFYAAIKDSFRIQSLLGGLLLLGLVIAPPVTLAQEEGAEAEEEITSDEVPADEEEEEAAPAPQRAIEEVVVTGSRLRRDTFSSIAPLQVITGEVSRESGLMNAADILQESTAATGQQVDVTFQGFVLDDGPGSSTVDLRGLGAQRTLVLLNGRRMPPGGVEGVPTSPNLNMIPTSLVQRYDILLDGASSVYGSDAVAGVANMILRKDFDGWEFESYSNVPYHGAGQEHTLRVTWGRNFDRGFVGAAVEYLDEEAVTLDDRPWTDECRKHVEVDENGRIRHKDLENEITYGMPSNGCLDSGLANRFQDSTFNSVYRTDGYSNGGWPNFSETNSSFGTFGVDGDGDGLTDTNWLDYSLNGREQFAHLFPPASRTSVLAYGEYTLEGDLNLTPYFEFLWGNRDYYANSGAGQFFPWVPANNPYNICNPEAEGGVDCGLAEDALLTNPSYLAQFSNWYTNLNGCFGLPPESCSPEAFGLLNGPLGATRSRPIVSVRGDRNNVTTETTVARLVGGVSGDLPFLNVATLSDWSFDFSLAYSISDATAGRVGIREDRFQLSIGDFSTTNTPCENDTGEELASDVAPGCVPVNMYAPSLYPAEVVGDFATQAERDYLFDSRDFDTEYEQTLISFFMTGDVFELPGGMVAAGVGLEWRKDEIRSIPDHVARDGLLWGFFADGGAEGDKITQEAFVEIELPLLAGVTLAEELTLNLSARLTDDEYYGTAWTESFKLAYRPFNSLLLRSTYGTSYRAPNLRELFLRGQTGFTTVFDPCFIPDEAWDALEGMYVPERDQREAYVLDNCRANGVDPTTAWNGGFNNFSTEVEAGGATDLQEETSTSQTIGFSWEQPFTNEFQLAIGATLYEIEIKNTVIEPGSQFIVNDCYYTETGASPFCTRIFRDFSDPVIPRFDIINRGFINRDLERAEGLDLNLSFEDTYTILDRPVDLLVDFNAHRLLERSTEEVDDDGNLDSAEYQGEWYFPYWTYRVIVRLNYDRWRLSWSSRYIDGQKSDPAFQDEFGSLDGDTFANTCLGPPDDVLCKDVDWVSDYMTHNLSLYYRADAWTVGGGIRNVFDEEPPFVHEGATLYHNAPRGGGYSLDGRVFFLNLEVGLGGGE
jgi:iron complex outermembrane receptor protein